MSGISSSHDITTKCEMNILNLFPFNFDSIIACLLQVMSRFHGSERLTLDRVMVRAGSGPSRLLPNPGRLADKAFLNAYSDNIQVCTYAASMFY